MYESNKNKKMILYSLFYIILNFYIKKIKEYYKWYKSIHISKYTNKWDIHLKLIVNQYLAFLFKNVHPKVKNN